MTKYTEWYPAEIKPVRVGVYQVHREDVFPRYPQRSWLLFDGVDWIHTKHSGGYDGGHADMSGSNKWRGLRSKP